MSDEKQSGDSGIPKGVLPTVQAGGPRGDAPAVAGSQNAASPTIEIKWAGKIFRFHNKAEALAAGFHIED